MKIKRSGIIHIWLGCSIMEDVENFHQYMQVIFIQLWCMSRDCLGFFSSWVLNSSSEWPPNALPLQHSKLWRTELERKLVPSFLAYLHDKFRGSCIIYTLALPYWFLLAVKCFMRFCFHIYLHNSFYPCKHYFVSFWDLLKSVHSFLSTCLSLTGVANVY